MLHITTEIGKPGKIERERRHFPQIDNQPGDLPSYRPRGRRYIPHGYGMYDEWRPHPQGVQPQYTDSGPDWKSRLKYIPDPENPKYPAAEIFENNWKAMRPYPFDLATKMIGNTYMNTSNEWLLDPGLSSRGMRCKFNGEHMATRTSADEITHTMLFGRGRNLEVIDKRNGIGEAAPGDKPYHTPEFSSRFHKLGSTLPVIEFGYVPEDANSPWKKQPDTFVPLRLLPSKPREPFRVKARREEKEIEKMTVKGLDEWRPATPLKPEKVEEKK